MISRNTLSSKMAANASSLPTDTSSQSAMSVKPLHSHQHRVLQPIQTNFNSNSSSPSSFKQNPGHQNQQFIRSSNHQSSSNSNASNNNNNNNIHNNQNSSNTNGSSNGTRSSTVAGSLYWQQRANSHNLQKNMRLISAAVSNSSSASLSRNPQFASAYKQAVAAALAEDELATEFEYCDQCKGSMSSQNAWLLHLVQSHALPTYWLSDKAAHLNEYEQKHAYTIVTDSRKKRRKHNIPRPLNSFMIFSRHIRRCILLVFKEASNSELSKQLGIYWKDVSDNVRQNYECEAKRLTDLHNREFPNYKYQPKKKKICAPNGVASGSASMLHRPQSPQIGAGNTTAVEAASSALITHVATDNAYLIGQRRPLRAASFYEGVQDAARPFEANHRRLSMTQSSCSSSSSSSNLLLTRCHNVRTLSSNPIIFKKPQIPTTCSSFSPSASSISATAAGTSLSDRIDSVCAASATLPTSNIFYLNEANGVTSRQPTIKPSSASTGAQKISFSSLLERSRTEQLRLQELELEQKCKREEADKENRQMLQIQQQRDATALYNLTAPTATTRGGGGAYTGLNAAIGELESIGRIPIMLDQLHPELQISNIMRRPRSRAQTRQHNLASWENFDGSPASNEQLVNNCVFAAVSTEDSLELPSTNTPLTIPHEEYSDNSLPNPSDSIIKQEVQQNNPVHIFSVSPAKPFVPLDSNEDSTNPYLSGENMFGELPFTANLAAVPYSLGGAGQSGFYNIASTTTAASCSVSISLGGHTAANPSPTGQSSQTLTLHQLQHHQIHQQNLQQQGQHLQQQQLNTSSQLHQLQPSGIVDEFDEDMFGVFMNNSIMDLTSRACPPGQYEYENNDQDIFEDEPFLTTFSPSTFTTNASYSASASVPSNPASFSVAESNSANSSVFLINNDSTSTINFCSEYSQMMHETLDAKLNHQQMQDQTENKTEIASFQLQMPDNDASFMNIFDNDENENRHPHIGEDGDDEIPDILSTLRTSNSVAPP